MTTGLINTLRDMIHQLHTLGQVTTIQIYYRRPQGRLEVFPFLNNIINYIFTADLFIIYNIGMQVSSTTDYWFNPQLNQWHLN